MIKQNGFEALLALHPWPDDPHIDGVEPFSWSLDGGGRHLIDSVIAERPTAVLAEFGSFMGGSALGFLRASPTLRCVLCDPWGENLVAYVAGLIDKPWALRAYGAERLAAYSEILKSHGPMAVVRNNLAQYRDRCVLVKQGMPGVFETMAQAGLAPDIVYLDAMKRREEFWGAHEAFPDAIITGDDWSWKDPVSGDSEVRRHVVEVGRARNATVFADRMTFVISEPRHRLGLDERFLYEHPEG